MRDRCQEARQLLVCARGRQPPGEVDLSSRAWFDRACGLVEQQLSAIEGAPASASATAAALAAVRAARLLDSVTTVPQSWAGDGAIAQALQLVGAAGAFVSTAHARSSKGTRNGGRRQEPTFTAEQEKRIVTIYEQRARDGELYGAMKHLRSTFDTTDPTLRSVLKKHGVKLAKDLKGG